MEFTKHLGKPPSLKDMLHEKLSGPDKPHNFDVLHASDLTSADGFCPREFALMRELGRERKGRYIQTSLRYTFDVGLLLEDLLRDNYLRDVAWGWWECRVCKKSKLGKEPPLTECGHNTACQWVYTGLRAELESVGMTAGFDMVVDFGGTAGMRIIEVKTMSKDDFKSLAAPLSEHTLRTQLYLWYAEKAGYAKYGISLDYAHIFYMVKGFGCKQADGRMSPFKEYIIKQDKRQLKPYLAKASALNTFTNTGKYPAGICGSLWDKRAKKCTVCHDCFSGKYKVGVISNVGNHKAKK